MMNLVITGSGFLLCSSFLWICQQRRSVQHDAFWVTLAAWGVFGYELLRQVYPGLRVPQPFRYYQYRAHLAIVIVYGWEVIQYVKGKVVQHLAGQAARESA